MSKLTLVVTVKTKPDKIDFVKSEIEKLIPITRQEEGCINYDLHQDNKNPAHFLLFENWESRELWEIHMTQPHLARYLEATEGTVDEFIVNEMTQIA